MRDAKRAYWSERLEVGGIEDALMVTEQFRSWMMEVGGSWPTEAQRREDLQTHQRVAAAFDITGCSARLDANLTGTLRTSDHTDVGTTTFVGRGDNTASPAAARVLAGVQLNLWKLKVYGQVNGAATPAASVGFGMRGRALSNTRR